MALPRGGVPVGYEVAAALHAPLDVIVARKLGAPMHRELGIGAIAEGGVLALNRGIVAALRVDQAELDAIARDEERELERRVRSYRDGRPPVNVAGRTAILVDDGIATGATATAAARALRKRGAARVVLAVPVGPPDAGIRFAGEVDDYVCPSEPVGFFAVGAYYDDFAQVSDAEVCALLGQAPEDDCDPPSPLDPPRVRGGVDWTQITHREVAIPASPDVLLHGDLRLPPAPERLIVFAHGSGSSRLSPRNIQVAGALCADGFATLLFDLLEDREAADRRKVFDIALLTERLLAATAWAARQEELSDLPVGYFGASTGAAAALCAAADPRSEVAAVVCRGGRPDLATERLAEVTAPTLLIVGGADRAVIELNRQAQLSLRCPSTLLIVPGAGHLFEEPGALEQVADEASRWFCDRLARPRQLARREDHDRARAVQLDRPDPTLGSGMDGR